MILPSGRINQITLPTHWRPQLTHQGQREVILAAGEEVRMIPGLLSLRSQVSSFCSVYPDPDGCQNPFEEGEMGEGGGRLGSALEERVA